jgi:hypothetical protein
MLSKYIEELAGPKIVHPASGLPLTLDLDGGLRVAAGLRGIMSLYFLTGEQAR